MPLSSVFMSAASAGGGTGGGGVISFDARPRMDYDGKWTDWHIEYYDGVPYWEAILYTSGTLAVTGTVVADAWGIGGGGGCNMAQGGGSGYTNMATDLDLTGNIAVSIGAGGAHRSAGGNTTLGSLLTCQGGGGAPNYSNGGSGGSANGMPGGKNGSNGSNGAGDGQPICRFRDLTKVDDAGDGGTAKAGGGAGGGGWLHWRANDGQNGCGYGGGGSFHQSGVGPGNQGALVLRVKI